MKNAEKFQEIFKKFATEVWAFPEKDFLTWLNAECEELTTKCDSKFCPDRKAKTTNMETILHCIENECAAYKDGKCLKYNSDQEPTTKNDLGVDCISREQAKAAIRDKFKDLPSRVEINTILNELPSITPKLCEDAISRQALLNATVKKSSIWSHITNSDGDNLEAIVSKLPPVTPQELRWIPCSERLPEKDGEYLLWGKICEDEENNYRFIGEYDSCAEEFGYWSDYYDSSTLGFLDSEHIEYHKVLAWMPLPPSYSEVEE